jgi:hypothetical protein
METTQFRILFRQFLFRIADLQIVSSQGDVSKLLGQLVALLLFVGFLFSLRVMSLDRPTTPEEFLVNAWGTEHSLIAATMLVVGIFAVLSWETTFLELRDVLILCALPIRTRTLFLAKTAATASALALTIVALNLLTGVALPLALSPNSSSLLDLLLSPTRYRSFGAYWMTVLSAGAFVFCCVLGVQGFASQILPRGWYLKVSALLQVTAFCVLLSGYLLLPAWTNPADLSAPDHHQTLAGLPSYWFLGLFQELNGSTHAVMAPLARRARYALAFSLLAMFLTYGLSYVRTLKRITEEPEIVRSSLDARWRWCPSWGGSLFRAILLFSIRSLLRSRRHRMLMAFYLGAGLTAVILFAGLPRWRQQLSVSEVREIFASLVLMCTTVMGARVVFTIPLDLRANWIFRMTQVRPAEEYVSAIRVPLFALAVAPVWLGSAAFFFWTWRPSLAVAHLMVLALAGTILAWISLWGFKKIPFTCSWLPGKTFIHMAFLAVLGCLILLAKGAAVEWQTIGDLRQSIELVAVLVFVAIAVATAARRKTVAAIHADEGLVQFEEVAPPAILELGLFRDGVLPE